VTPQVLSGRALPQGKHQSKALGKESAVKRDPRTCSSHSLDKQAERSAAVSLACVEHRGAIGRGVVSVKSLRSLLDTLERACEQA